MQNINKESLQLCEGQSRFTPLQEFFVRVDKVGTGTPVSHGWHDVSSHHCDSKRWSSATSTNQCCVIESFGGHLMIHAGWSSELGLAKGYQWKVPRSWFLVSIRSQVLQNNSHLASFGHISACPWTRGSTASLGVVVFRWLYWCLKQRKIKSISACRNKSHQSPGSQRIKLFNSLIPQKWM